MILNLNPLKSFTLSHRLHSFLLTTLSSSSFSSASTSSSSSSAYSNKQKAMIRNYNLNFDADNYIVNLYPCYPEIYAKKQNHIFEVSNRYPVLIMNFIKKDREFQNAWAQRKTMYFKYDDVAMFALFKAGNSTQIKLTHVTSSYPYSELKRTLSMIDLKSEQKIKLTYEQQTKTGNKTTSTTYSSSKPKAKAKSSSSASQSQNKPISLTMPYRDYRMMHKLIQQKSIFQMSGWKFMTDFTKKQQLNKLDQRVQSDRAMDNLFRDQP